MVAGVQRTGWGQHIHKALAGLIVEQAVTGRLLAGRAHIGHHRQIGIAVVVIVAPGRADRLVVQIHTARLRGIGEPAVGVATPQDVATVVRDEDVQMAVIVIVADRTADAALIASASGILQTQLRRDIDKRRPVIAPQRVGLARLVGQEQVEVAVLVVVQPAGPDRRASDRWAGIHERLDELAAVVPVKPVRSGPVGSVEVQVAVVVVVDPIVLARGASRHGQADLGGDVRETLAVEVSEDRAGLVREA